ncbi:MAG TPA: DUF2270 domain-containing protein [Alphaproteobacteria bacterium]|nr:DUF2270 domain-containing protein [Alphaproteobacteria bacterium]
MDEVHSSTVPAFSPAELGALAHLYRGEVYRSTVWRTRLDATTNWAVVATGLALSLTFSDPDASALPLVLVGLLVALFLSVEARRYRFFDFWRIRAHILELQLFGPILRGEGVRTDNGWNQTLYQDYLRPNLHISFLDAVGRRLRRNYGWIFLIQATSYVGKLLIHPEPVASFDEFLRRAMIGPIPGGYVLIAGLLFHGTWIVIALAAFFLGRRGRRPQRISGHRDALLDLARGSS